MAVLPPWFIVGAGLRRACREADIVLTRQSPKYLCKSGLVVSDDDLDRHGGVLIYQGDPPKLVSVADKPGKQFRLNTDLINTGE